MTKKINEKIKEKEKEKELRSKKGQKSMQRNKTVSNFRNTRRDRNNNIITNNNSRTLKANKSMGHILRKDKNDKEKKDIDFGNKKPKELKYLSMTPKRSEKAKSFYSKTDANRRDIDKNERFNRKKSEKKLITNLTIKGKEDKIKDKKEKKISKKEENDTIKKIDVAKSNKRPSKQIIREKEKEKEKKDTENYGKEKIKDNKNKDKDKESNKYKINDKKEKKEDKKEDKKKEDKKGIKNQKKKDNKEGEKKELKKKHKKMEDKKKEENKKETERKEENKKKEEEKEEKEEKEEGKKDVEKKEEKEIKEEDKELIKSEKQNQQNIIKENDKGESETKANSNIKFSKFLFHRLINFYDKIHRFLDDEEKKNLLILSKDSALSILPIFKELNSKQIQENEKDFNEFKSKYKEEEYLTSINPFQLNKAAIKILEKLNEENSAKIFTSEEIPNKDLIYIYRLFLQLINKDPKIRNKNDKEFWKLAKDKIFTNKKGQLSEHVKEMLTQLDFSEENLRIVNDIYKECMDKFSIPKYYNNLCPTTGIFFFLVKEILEYCGILVGKKTAIPLIYKRLDYELKLNKKKEEKLNRMNEMAHKKKSLFIKSD